MLNVIMLSVMRPIKLIFFEMQNKLDCFTIASLYSLVEYLQARPRAHPRGKEHKGDTLR
jgi:hypothetical protein